MENLDDFDDEEEFIVPDDIYNEISASWEVNTSKILLDLF